MIRIAVLASGGGTNLGAILAACAEGRIDGGVVAVLSDVPGAGALDRARAAGAAAEAVARGAHAGRAEHEAALLDRLAAHAPDLVCLAGYMRLLSPAFVRAWGPTATTRGCPRLMNIHPGLLPAFPGLHAPAQALRYGVRLAGCTVHFVDEGTDTGPVIAQAVVPVRDDDDEAALAARILEQEHQLYPRAVGWFAEGRLALDGRRVRVDGAAPPAGALRSPVDVA